MWCERYEIADEFPVATQDIDFYGGPDAARECAQRLGGRLTLAEPFEDATPNTAVVTFEDENGHEREIDFLRSVHGLTGNLRSMGLELQFASEAASDKSIAILLLHPVLVLKSRASNVASLPGYDGPHGRNQLRAAIRCACEYVHEQLNIDERRALNANEEIFKVACDRHALTVYRRFDIDIAEAITTDARLGKFNTERYPRMMERLKRLRAKRTSRLASSKL